MTISPLSASMIAAIIFISVDFPAPLGPTKPKQEARLISICVGWSARFFPYDFSTCLICNIISPSSPYIHHNVICFSLETFLCNIHYFGRKMYKKLHEKSQHSLRCFFKAARTKKEPIMDDHDKLLQ